MLRDKPEYNKKAKLNYKIDLVELTLYEVFFYLIFHSNNLAKTGIIRAFGYILGQKIGEIKRAFYYPNSEIKMIKFLPFKMINAFTL